MGKKGKGTKKEDKPKKEVPQTTAAKNKAMQEALEGINVTVSTPTPRVSPPPRTSASKKSDRGGSPPTKIGCTESFRWDNSEEAPVLPRIEQRERERLDRISNAARAGRSFFQQAEPLAWQGYNSLARGWQAYLNWRYHGEPAALLPSALTSKTLKDGLSVPLTIANMVIQWMMSNSPIATLGAIGALETRKPLHIVVVGATAVCEEKILRESDYWNELLALMGKRNVRLYLTGPEMSGKDGEFKRKRPGAEEGQQQEEDGPRVECWKARAIDFFLQKGRLELFRKEETVVVGLNCGFGVAARRVLQSPASKQELPSNQVVWDWIPTLHFIAALELPLMITGCAEQDAIYTRIVLEHAVGMYNVVDVRASPAPFDSAISGSEHEVRANSFFTIVQGQQPGYHFNTESPQSGEKDVRIEDLRKAASRSQSQSSKEWSKFSYKSAEERASPLVPLKRYGKNPPESREKSSQDDGGSDSDVPVGAERGKEKEGLLPPAVVKLKHSVVDEGPGSLKIIVEDVLMTDPATARVGMRRNRFTLHYFDCETLRDVVFEAALPKEVHHTSTQTTFKPSAASLTIVVRLLESKN